MLKCAAEMSRRTAMIAATSRERMRLHMACKKCKVLWIQLVELVGPTTPEDVAALGLRHNCECGKPFACSFGLTIHRHTCIAANEVMELAQDDGNENHDINALLEVRGPPPLPLADFGG
jgi:hypothetical protein